MKWLLALTLFVFAVGSVQAVDDIAVRGLFKNRILVEIDGKRHMLRKGQTSPEGVKLISSDSREAVLEINGERRTLALGGRIHTRYKQAEEVEEVLWPTSNGMFLTVGTINGRTVEFLIDTGATYIAMNAEEARRLGVKYRSGQEIRISTANGVVRAWLVTLDKVSVGSITVRNVKASIQEGPGLGRTLLGMSFLNQVRMERDGGSMRLQQKAR